MNLPKKYWHNEPLGKEVLFKHDCADQGHTGNLYVKRVEDGYVFTCFSCGSAFSGFQPIKTSSNHQTLNRLSNKSYNESLEKTCTLPLDFSLDIPKQGVRWLKQYNITESEINEFNIGYSAKYNVVIIPIRNNWFHNRLSGWQGRNLAFDPKKKGSVKYHTEWDHKTRPFYFLRQRDYSTLCIVEDILSAIKVGRYCSALALLGSHIPDNLLPVLKQYTTIFIYLDYDKLKESIKFSKRLASILQKDVISLINQKDPKELPDGDLKVMMWQ